MLVVGYLSALFPLFILVLGNHRHASHICCNNTVVVFGFDVRREKFVKTRYHFILFLQSLPFFAFFYYKYGPNYFKNILLEATTRGPKKLFESGRYCCLIYSIKLMLSLRTRFRPSYFNQLIYK
jgi:hypothetical protein